MSTPNETSPQADSQQPAASSQAGQANTSPQQTTYPPYYNPYTPPSDHSAYYTPYQQSATAAPSHTATAVAARSPKRSWPAVILAAVAAAALASTGTAYAVGAFDSSTDAAAPVTVTSSSQVAQITQTDIESVVDDVMDSVVAIAVQTRSGEAEGSGVIIDTSGHVVTNYHVIEGASQIQVTLADGRIYTASIVGTDETTDLAVLALDDAPDDLVAATFGDSDLVAVGEDVIAVGNPLGLSSTVTTGIVSAVDRPVTTQSDTSMQQVVTNALQVDAAINPGNSGGPIFNANGEVIGITSSIASLASGSSESGSIGLGFAIPANLVARVAQEIITTGSASHAMLGVSLQDATVTVDGATRAGAEVARVVADSGAAEAGLQAGDVIISVDGHEVTGALSLTGYVRQYTPDTQVTLQVVRDGQELELTATLSEA